VPTPDMTLNEIYLEFRTAPGQALSIVSSIEETLTYVAIRSTSSFGAGYTVGSGASYLLENYAPDTNANIGGTVATMMTNVSNAVSDFVAGNLTKSLDDLFLGDD
jgi:hypothetical protein